MIDVAQVQGNMQEALGLALEQVAGGKARGVVALVFFEDGSAREYSDVRLVAPGTVVGVLEICKTQHVLSGVSRAQATATAPAPRA